MVVTPVPSIVLGTRGALGFLTRIPVPQSAETWDAFMSTPVTFPIAGYVIGTFFVFPFLFDLPRVTIAVVFVCWVFLLTGITHLDGVADFTDALVTTGSISQKHDVLSDPAVGTGGALGIGIVLLGLFAGGYLVASLPVTALGIVVAAEVVSKSSIVILTGFGSGFHEGLGSQFTRNTAPKSLGLPLLATVPVLLLLPTVQSTLLVVAGGIVLTGVLLQVSRTSLGGINGDALGATNELVRITTLHLGVIGWML